MNDDECEEHEFMKCRKMGLTRGMTYRSSRVKEGWICPVRGQSGVGLRKKSEIPRRLETGKYFTLSLEIEGD